MPEHQQTQRSTESKSTVKKQTTPRIQAPISHPMAIIQRARMNPKSLTHADVMQLQQTIGNRAVVRLLTEIGAIPSKAKQAPPVQRQELVQRQEIPEEEEPLQGKMAETVQRQEIPEEEEPLQGKFEGKLEEETCPSCMQKQEIPEEEEPLQPKRENNTGMPNNLNAGMENLSGIDMSDVKVHYNSSKPADVGALAYTQGTEIHVAPGQERHLPHEAWHVVQQAQGRVKPTMQIKGVSVNDNTGLENEADVMGGRAKSGLFSSVVQANSKYTDTLTPYITKPLSTCIQRASVSSVQRGNREDFQEIIDEVLSIVDAAERAQGAPNIGTAYRYLSGRASSLERPSTQGTYGAGASFALLPGMRRLGKIEGLAATGKVSWTEGMGVSDEDRLRTRSTAEHAEMQIVKNDPNVQAVFATQDCCLFCYGYLHKEGYQHGSLRANVLPVTGWTHPTNNFTLLPGKPGIGEVIAINYLNETRNFYIQGS